MKPKQECHEGRRRLPSRVLLGSLVLASASLNACGDDHGDDSADLQAILHDGDLTETMRSMLMPPGTGMAGTTGAGGATGGGGRGTAGSVGSGGTGFPTGIAGSGFPTGIAGTGFPTTGIGGSLGSAGTGGPGSTRNLPRDAQGFWRFDDCNMDRTELSDSSFFGHTAFRSVTAFCRPGVMNSGIGFDEDDDLVLVPDQPNFVFSEGFTVAAWVKPLALRRRSHDLPQAPGGHQHVRARRERRTSSRSSSASPTARRPTCRLRRRSTS